MEYKPSYEELIAKLAAQEEIIEALRNQEVDAVVGTKNILMLRLKKTEDQLKSQRDHLERDVEERTRELRELTHVLFDVQEEERQTIGNELYDEVCQLLASASLLLKGAIRKSDDKALVEVSSAISNALERIRKLPSVLVPQQLHILGLLKTMEHMVAEYQFRSNIKVEFDHTEGIEDVPEKIALAIFRITQESLLNINRHAKASDVKVRLLRRAGKLRLVVADNGTGFNLKAVRHSTGLAAMRERAQALGGKLTIESNRGQGTKVVAEFPLSESG